MVEREKVIIVDENNNQIGTKYRDEMDYSVDIYRSTGLWVTNSKGEILIAKRSTKKDKDPGLWGPAAAGTVDEGETYDANVAKEAEEEIGLRGVEFTKHDLVFYQYPRRQFTQWYKAECNWPIEKFELQQEEVEAVKWVNLQELKQDLVNIPVAYLEHFPMFIEQFNV